MHRKMVKSDLISAGHIGRGRIWPIWKFGRISARAGPDMISAATLHIIRPLAEALYTTFCTTNAQKIQTSGNWALVCMHQVTCRGVMYYVAVNLHDVIADEGDKTPVQGVHARCRYDEPGGGNQSLPQLLSRLVSNASHSSGGRRDGNCRQLMILSTLSVWQVLLRCILDGRVSGERPSWRSRILLSTLLFVYIVCYLFAPCGLQGCKNRAHSVSWPEVVKGVPNKGVDCFVS